MRTGVPAKIPSDGSNPEFNSCFSSWPAKLWLPIILQRTEILRRVASLA